MSLLQPAPETYALFDDIMLLSEGHIVFFGPLAGVMPFFEGLGFQKPVRKNVADFLQEVTSRKDQAVGDSPSLLLDPRKDTHTIGFADPKPL